MQPRESDTICAIATPPGRGGIGIIRISGSRVRHIAEQVLGFHPQPRHAHYCQFLDNAGTMIDQGIAIYYQAPDSFTGEDILELQGHGGVQVLNEIIERLCALDVRIANPGEFSERAFLNDKIDLVQAEAIADLIDASSRQAARSAVRTLQGEFSRRIHDLVSRLTGIRVNVEAAIDFSDEDIDVMTDTSVATALATVREDLEAVIDQARQGAILREGMSVVIAGRPNAGKSSLLNALSGVDSAIVTDIPGTTRDLLREEILVDGMPVHVTDTAGLRSSADLVEQEGIKRAQGAVLRADRILLVVDSPQARGQAVETLLEPLLEQASSPDHAREIMAITTLVFNKIDLCEDLPAERSAIDVAGRAMPRINLCARDGRGLDLLRQHLKDCIGFRSADEVVFVARERHILALKDARKALDTAAENVSKHSPLELVAEDLRVAQRALGTITGEFTPDDLLGEIFASFCVGK